MLDLASFSEPCPHVTPLCSPLDDWTTHEAAQGPRVDEEKEGASVGLSGADLDLVAASAGSVAVLTLWTWLDGEEGARRTRHYQTSKSSGEVTTAVHTWSTLSFHSVQQCTIEPRALCFDGYVRWMCSIHAVRLGKQRLTRSQNSPNTHLRRLSSVPIMSYTDV